MRSLVAWTRTGAPPGLEVCLEGEVWAVLDEGETLMRPGDVRIQRVPLWTSVLVRTYAWMVLLGRAEPRTPRCATAAALQPPGREPSAWSTCCCRSDCSHWSAGERDRNHQHLEEDKQ